MNVLPFEHRSFDEERIQEFERFFRNNAPELFSSLKIKPYKISDNDLRSVLNNLGKHRTVLTEFSNTISRQASNESHYEKIHKASILQAIHLLADGGFQKMINLLKEFNRLTTLTNAQFNIVWYTYFKNRVN